MSDALARETLMSIPPDELLEVHSKIKAPITISEYEARWFHNHSVMMYGLGNSLHASTMKSGWDDEFAEAIHSGSDRLSLSTLKWLMLKPGEKNHITTLQWLAHIPTGYALNIHDEVEDITEGNADTTAATEQAEAELEAYPAFVALGQNLETFLFEKEVPMKEAEIERLGVALGGLALKRELAKSHIDELEAQFLL